MRILLVAIAAALAVLAIGHVSASGAGGGSLSHQYVVQPDPRMCPSPRCGGYWVALANRRETPCSDGTLRPRCYVALAVGQNREPLAKAIPPGTLARGAIALWSEGPGRLGVLIATHIRSPVGKPDGQPIYRMRDAGIRCVKAPCFYLRAWLVSTSKVVTVSELELPAGLTPQQRTQAESALGKGGVFLAGRIVRASDGGRSLRATTVYLSP
jgi:hypothetical protein